MKPSVLMADAQQKMAAVRETIQALEQQAQQKWLECNAIVAQLTAAVNAPMTRKDVLPVVESALDSLSAVQGAHFRQIIGGCFGTRDSEHDLNQVSGLLHYQTINAEYFGRDWVLSLLLPVLKAGIPAALEALDWPDGALSKADRAAKITELEPVLEKLAAEREALIADLEGLGLKFNPGKF